MGPLQHTLSSLFVHLLFIFYAGVVGWAQLLERDPWVIAPHLLGSHLLSHVDNARVLVRITEVEAYGGVGQDPGSHSYRGMTPRTSVMFGPPGTMYVYFTYGMHWCLNIVASPSGTSGAVLLRAGEVIEGVDIAQMRAGRAMREVDLAKGPARLARTLGITTVTAPHLNGASVLQSGDMQLLGHPPRSAPVHEVGPRTGVGGAGAHIPWRFWLPGEATVSPYRSAISRLSTP